LAESWSTTGRELNLEYGRNRATVVLEDGAVFEGWSFAGDGEVAGEVVFTTSMAGYQETVTDPSYRGQIVLFTYPLIGNYGVIPGDEESRKVQAAGVLVREYTPHPSNWASERSLAVGHSRLLASVTSSPSR